jgi:uncharacterized protein with HEPN domain
VKSDEVYLKHILDAIEKIESYVAVGYDAFLATSHWQDATIRQLEIIGEATKSSRRTCAPNILKFRGVGSLGYGMC